MDLPFILKGLYLISACVGNRELEDRHYTSSEYWCRRWGKNSPENCLVDLGRDTRTSTQSRRLVRRKGVSWSLNWPSGANSLAHLQLKCILYVPL